MKKKWNEKPQTVLLKECLDYFREAPVFHRLLTGFREKYMSYGEFSGTVVLFNLTESDVETLEGFFQKNFHGQKSVTISAVRFEKALAGSRFLGISPKELLEAYFQEEMTGRREQRQAEEVRQREIFEDVRKKYEGTAAGKWLAKIRKERNGVYAWLMKNSREAKDWGNEERRQLELGAEIVNSLPGNGGFTEYLAVFAAKITGNPHAFDDGAKEGKLLYYIILWNAEEQGTKIETSEIFPALQKQRLYLAAGILRDDMSNYTMISGLRAWKRDGTVHEGMEGFFREGDCVQVPLSVIVGWEKVECPDNILYIVENPSVYAILSREWKGERACMCMNGQPRLSSVLLLDLLAKAGVKIFYAGDFDPEGLLIAQKIKQYYKGAFSYWNMSVQEYEACISENQISDRRIKILKHIVEPELAEVAEALRERKKAGYQENVCFILKLDKTPTSVSGK